MIGCILLASAAPGGELRQWQYETKCHPNVDATLRTELDLCAASTGCNMYQNATHRCEQARDFFVHLARLLDSKSRATDPHYDALSLPERSSRWKALVITNEDVFDAGLPEPVRNRGVLANDEAMARILAHWRADHHDEASLTLPDGGYYEGDVKNGKPEGVGVLILPDGGEVVRGQFVDGKVNGQGQVIFPDGNKGTGGLAIDPKSGFVLMDGPGAIQFSGPGAKAIAGGFRLSVPVGLMEITEDDGRTRLSYNDEKGHRVNWGAPFADGEAPVMPIVPKRYRPLSTEPGWAPRTDPTPH